MFTSAAEHRLLLRADNADERLAGIGHRIGMLELDQLERVRRKYSAIDAEAARLGRVQVRVSSPGRPDAPSLERGPAPSAGGGHAPETSVGLERAPETSASAWASIPALDFLARPEGSYRALASLGVETPLPPAWADCLEVRVRYRGYIERQRRTAERAEAQERVELPPSLWGCSLAALSHEAREKLCRWKPATIGQAGRIAGVSPADLAVLLMLARRHQVETAVAG